LLSQPSNKPKLINWLLHNAIYYALTTQNK
jgi:hypothetical protein